MSDPYLGEIRIASFTIVPRGWALCNGQLLPINANQALFSILGTTYGGDGRTTFGLPDLRGRIPLGTDTAGAWNVGQVGGEVSHTLTTSEMPAHNHLATAQTAAATVGSPTGALWATTAQPTYAAGDGSQMAASAVATYGGSQPHENESPFLVLSFVIAVQGIFPSRT